MITVIFHIDLKNIISGVSCSSEQSTAVLRIQKSIEGAGLTGSPVQYQAEAVLVLVLPNNEKALGALSYWCNYGKIPYKTLWLNDVSEWRDG